MKPILLAASTLVFLMVACNTTTTDSKAATIVKDCIQVHGGKSYENMDVSFTFRQFRVHLKHVDGRFLYERTTTDSLNNHIHDILTNDGFKRMINNQEADLSPKDTEKYKEGINAIAYFALLPYKLSEPAVQLEYLGENTIDNQAYHKIGVSFNKNGGGKDHEDEFCYWINKQTKTMDYLSYASGGPRFRKATRQAKIDGIIFQDYANYELSDTTLHPSQYDEVYKAGNANLLSTIEQTRYATGNK